MKGSSLGLFQHQPPSSPSPYYFFLPSQVLVCWKYRTPDSLSQNQFYKMSRCFIFSLRFEKNLGWIKFVDVDTYQGALSKARKIRLLVKFPWLSVSFTRLNPFWSMKLRIPELVLYLIRHLGNTKRNGPYSLTHISFSVAICFILVSVLSGTLCILHCLFVLTWAAHNSSLDITPSTP